MASTAMPNIRTLAPAVATHLGAGWKSKLDPEQPRYSAHLTHQDGRQVSLYIDQYASGRDAGRLHVDGQQPEPRASITVEHSRFDFGHITVAGTKTPRQVAAGVSRRLLPDFTAALTKWQAKVAQLCAEEAERTETARRLAEVLGTGRRPVPPTVPGWTRESCTCVGTEQPGAPSSAG